MAVVGSLGHMGVCLCDSHSSVTGTLGEDHMLKLGKYYFFLFIQAYCVDFVLVY